MQTQNERVIFILCSLKAVENVLVVGMRMEEVWEKKINFFVLFSNF